MSMTSVYTGLRSETSSIIDNAAPCITSLMLSIMYFMQQANFTTIMNELCKKDDEHRRKYPQLFKDLPPYIPM